MHAALLTVAKYTVYNGWHSTLQFLKYVQTALLKKYITRNTQKEKK